ncbi:hypothetical protein [Nocardia sp. NPDC046763]|uniref:hypothetical protein n=1 Tax=Nocardia sp. NPDC046763 TaxID=3155256 RepID=UPI0033CCF5EA
MPEPTEPAEFDAIAAKLKTEREAEAMRAAEMFTNTAICNLCGAFVAMPWQHKAFHDVLDRSAENLLRYVEAIGKAAGVIPDA